MSVFRYSRWDGSQDPFSELTPANPLSDALSDELLAGRSPEEALRRLLEHGMPGSFGGLQSLRDRLRRLGEARRHQGRIDGLLDELRQELEEIVGLEREALAERQEPEARFREAVLDQLPSQPAGQVEALRHYSFASSEAGRRFQELLERLRQEVLGGYLDRVAGQMRDFGEQDRAALKDMLADLNRMLEQRRLGTGPSRDEFDEFMRRHGRFFPDDPRNLDELLEGLARRAAAMSRLLASLSPQYRAQLEALARELLDDLDLQFQVDQLLGNLRSLLPELGWDQPVQMQGDQPLGMGEALSEIEEISRFEQLEACMRQDYPGATLEDVDIEQVRRSLGEEAARDVERLRRLERALEEAGMVVRRQGRLELTPRGLRKLGERALAKVFERLTLDRFGSHQVREAGGFGEPTGSTRPWRFGDPFRIDIQRTVYNAVVREGGHADGPVRLHPDDFELAEAEVRTSTATVLLLDMSRSMPLRGHWAHAKQMALALHTLIQTTYPEDHLSVVGFSDYARKLQPTDLTKVDWEPVYGTNMEHAFLLAGRLLSRQPASTKQVLLVTDGEPTAHLVGEHVFFHWPPVRETLERTYQEALRLARSGITMNIFMLERSPGLVHFIDRLARLVRGRVFSVDDQQLGAFVVRDYLVRRGT
ncbi:MAG: VWA domain-containing protein [Actinomycetota bacterium]|nr:VWA domain-containing protein [Actinomycetota bacterium]